VSTNRVSSQFLNKVLDVLAGSNGLRAVDIASEIGCSQSAVSAAVCMLKELGCISEGAVQYFRKDGQVTLHNGYFYEQNLPVGFVTRGSMHRKVK